MAKRPTGSVPPSQNRLLAGLPPPEFQRLLPRLQQVTLEPRQILHRKGEPIEYVYFPGGGICSLVTPLADGRMVEMAVIGSEGLVGGAPGIGASPAQENAIVQIESAWCQRMGVEDFRREMDRREALHDVVHRFGQALIGFVMQSAACNAVHSVEQRLSRWLLMAHDRVRTDEFPLTQELVATMLGTSRPTVTIVAGTLQKAGLIQYRHGRMTILNRQSLESASCECYRVVTNAMQTFLPRYSGARSR